MKQYLICYDLVDADSDDYKSVKLLLKKMKAERLQKSVWRVFDRSGAANIIFDRLYKVIDDDDRLLVVSIEQSDGREYNLIKGRTIHYERITKTGGKIGVKHGDL